MDPSWAHGRGAPHPNKDLGPLAHLHQGLSSSAHQTGFQGPRVPSLSQAFLPTWSASVWSQFCHRPSAQPLRTPSSAPPASRPALSQALSTLPSE